MPNGKMIWAQCDTQLTQLKKDNLIKHVTKKHKHNVIHCKRTSEYTELVKLWLLLFTISPETCELERGFSRMNFVKNEFRSTLSNRNLNDVVAVNMGERDLNSFPIEKCL